MMKKYYLETFWCAMNYSDSEKIQMILLESSFLKTNNWKNSNLIILNTCSVRQKWEDKVFWFIEEIYRENKKRIKDNKKIIQVWITWCMVRKTWIDERYLKEYKRDRRKSKKIINLNSQEQIFNNDDKIFPRAKEKIDFVFRIEDIKYLSFILSHTFQETLWKDYKFDNYLKAKQLRENPSSAIVVVQTWCDNYCSYCIVPHTRWLEKSRSIEEIIQEAKEAVKAWAKEITLVWQNVNSYWKQFVQKWLWNEEKGKWEIFPSTSGRGGRGEGFTWELTRDWNFKSPFRLLLEELDKIDWLERIRFTSSNPHDMTKDILDAHFDLKKTCNYLHFAMQSWNNEILKKMNRKHTYENFRDMVKYLREKDPYFSISTDIIAGFPWETESMFEDTLKAFDELEFDFSYNARYSQRTWTIAAKLYEDNIDEKEKSKRWHTLNDKLLETITKRNKMMLNREEEVLIYSQKDSIYRWRTKNFKEVFFPWKDLKIWDMVIVKITDLDKYVLKWELIWKK